MCFLNVQQYQLLTLPGILKITESQVPDSEQRKPIPDILLQCFSWFRMPREDNLFFFILAESEHTVHSPARQFTTQMPPQYDKELHSVPGGY